MFRAYAEEKGSKLGVIAQPLRAALTGSTISPPVFGVASLLGKKESLRRIGARYLTAVRPVTQTGPK